MTINNINRIRDFLTFEEDIFYFLQILKRRKENPDMETGVKVIKSFFIDSIEYFDRKVAEIIQLCEDNNARAYINLNKRSYQKATVDMIKYLADSISNGQYRNCKFAFEKIAGQNRADKEKKWILDVDVKSKSYLVEISDYIASLKPEGEKVRFINETKNGYHIICKPFDPRTFKDKFADVEIQKDNPTILYIP